MPPIKIKISLPLFGKEKKKEIKTIRFSEVKNYLEELRDKKEISEYYGKLKRSYEDFMEKLHEIEKALEILEDEGEKTFTPIVRKRLERIEKLNKFNISSYQEFYTNTFHIIDGIVKISPRTQYQVLEYEKGKETIDLVNSFLEKIQDLKKILAKRYSEYSVVNHFENALRKQKEIEGLMKKVESKKGRFELSVKEEIDAKKLFEGKNNNLEDVKSKLNHEKAKKLKIRIDSLNSEIEMAKTELKANLLGARRPISKVLHSVNDKKIFEFFQKKFIKYPLEHINEKFWLLVDIVKKENIKLDENERKEMNEFLKFVENSLHDKHLKYKNLKMDKKKIEDMLEEISLKNREILERFKNEKKRAKKEFRIKKRRLENFRKEKDELEDLLRKKIKSLEIVLSKVSENEIRIKT